MQLPLSNFNSKAMTIHQQIFSRKRPVFSKLVGFGFSKTEDGVLFARDFMGGDFTAIVKVSKDGRVCSCAWDNMNDEEYSQVDAEGIVGGYVGDVRMEFERILQNIANNCFEDVLFASDQANRITAKIAELYGVTPDFPWNDDPYSAAGVFRHADTGKWFGLVMRIKRAKLVPSADERELVDVINLKRTGALNEPYPVGVFPAYHMNHKLWISVLLDDTLDDSNVLSLISASFTATTKRK